MPQDKPVSTDETVKVSVITRTKNRALFLERARAGLAAQTFKDFEWIVVNDGGSRADIEPILSMPAGKYGKARLIDLKDSQGRAGAAIAGLDAARGEYCLIHDDDDALMPDALAILVSALDAEQSTVAVICGVKTITEKAGGDGKFTAYGSAIVRQPQSNPLLIDLAYRNSFMTISTLFRKDAYNRAGGINADLDVLEDWDLWLRLMLEGDVIAVPDVLAAQYVRENAGGDAAQSAQADHLKADIYLRNYYLRQDIKSGSFGLGRLMNMHHRQTLEEMSALTKSLRRIKKRILFWR